MNTESQENTSPELLQVIRAASGAPFKREQDALSSLKQRNLPVEDWEVVRLTEGGYELRQKAGVKEKLNDPIDVVQPNENVEEKVKQKQVGRPKKAPKIEIDTDIEVNQAALNKKIDGMAGEKFYEVIFAARQSLTETEDVQLSVNGQTIVIQRQQKVIIPERFVECARNAIAIRFVQIPKVNRKVPTKTSTYPFTIIREDVSREEFLVAFERSNKKHREDVARFGHDVLPQQVDEYNGSI